MLEKEIREIIRSYRWLMLPIVFLFLGLGQPVSFKLMPEILKNANLPPGTVLEIPPPAPMDVMTSVLSQFSQLGVLVIILMVMGSVAQEKASGVAASVLVKPVRRGVYLGAKFLAYSLLTVMAYVFSLGLSAYYTEALIGPVSWGQVLSGAVIYLPYLILAVALTILTSTLFSTQAAAAAASFVAILALTLLPKLGKWSGKIFPGALSGQAELAFHGAPTDALWQPLLFTLAIIAALLTAAWITLKQQEL